MGILKRVKPLPCIIIPAKAGSSSPWQKVPPVRRLHYLFGRSRRRKPQSPCLPPCLSVPGLPPEAKFWLDDHPVSADWWVRAKTQPSAVACIPDRLSEDDIAAMQEHGGRLREAGGVLGNAATLTSTTVIPARAGFFGRYA